MKLKRAFRVWQRHFTVYTKLYKSSFALNFVEPVLYLAALGLGLGAFVKEINGVPYINFIAPGIIASSAMFAASYECTYGTYVRMTYHLVNICRSLAQGNFKNVQWDILWVFVVVTILAPYPFRLMRKRIIK